MLADKRKSHRLNGGFYKWWAIARYLRTQFDELSELVDKTKKLTLTKRYATT